MPNPTRNHSRNPNPALKCGQLLLWLSWGLAAVTGRTFGPIIRFVNTQNRQNVIKFSAESGARKAAPSFEIRFNIVNCVQNFVIPFCQFRWKREWEWGGTGCMQQDSSMQMLETFGKCKLQLQPPPTNAILCIPPPFRQPNSPATMPL